MPQPLRGEVWRVDFNPLVGTEQGDIRPAIVISINVFNGASRRCVVVPLTKTKKDIPTWLPIEPPEGGIARSSSILCDQIRSISVERFSDKMGEVSGGTLRSIETTLRRLLAIS